VVVGTAGSIIQTADTGTGHASHLGRYTLAAGEHIDLATGAITRGFYTLTAANGDTISGIYTGRALPGLTGYLVSGTVSGGTGRFAGATGFLVWRGTVDPTALTFSDLVTGWISPPRSRDDEPDDGRPLAARTSEGEGMASRCEQLLHAVKRAAVLAQRLKRRSPARQRANGPSGRRPACLRPRQRWCPALHRRTDRPAGDRVPPSSARAPDACPGASRASCGGTSLSRPWSPPLAEQRDRRYAGHAVTATERRQLRNAVALGAASVKATTTAP